MIMKLSGWVWVIAGAIIAAVSGYVYWTVPKDGEPNMAMALFFFVGIVFIIVGIMRLFFKRAAEQSILDSVQRAQPDIGNIQSTLQPNQIDQHIQQLTQQKTPQQAQRSPQAPQQPSNDTQVHQSHSNTYSQKHGYAGPVHTTQSPHAVQQNPQTASHHAAQQHHVQNSEHGLRCRKCGNVNSGNANYCHQCGNRLK